MASPSFPDATRIPSRSPARAGVTLLFSGLLACTGAINTSGSGSPAEPGGRNPNPVPGETPRAGPGSPGTMPPAAQNCGLPPARIWALTPGAIRAHGEERPARRGHHRRGPDRHHRRRAQGFSNEASRLALTEPHLGQLLELAYQLASDAAADPAKLAPCLAAGAARAPPACATSCRASPGGPSGAT